MVPYLPYDKLCASLRISLPLRASVMLFSTPTVGAFLATASAGGFLALVSAVYTRLRYESSNVVARGVVNQYNSGTRNKRHCAASVVKLFEEKAGVELRIPGGL